MKTIRTKLGVFLCLILCSPFLAFAQDVSVTAEVDRNPVGVGEEFSYNIVVSGKVDKSMQLQIPDFGGNFQVLSQSQQSSYSMINGQVSSSQTRQFILAATKPGELVIPSAKLVGSAGTVLSQAVTMHVKKGAARTDQSQGGNVSGGDAVILRGVVNKSTVYEGEEVIYQLEFLRRVQLWSSISYQFPGFQGFWVESLKAKKDEYSKHIDGKEFGVKELVKKSLFPIHAGKATISSSKAGFVLNPFEGDRVVESKPLTILVKPLPTSGKPADFSGLVGDVTLSGTSLPSVVTQNQPLTVHITLKGSGGITRVSEVVVHQADAFKVYKSKTQDALTYEDGVKGKRVFDYVVIPKQAGKYKGPSFSLSFFNPAEGRYKTVTVEGALLTVLPSSDRSEISDFQGVQPQNVMQKDIRYLHVPLTLGTAEKVKRGFVLALGFLNGVMVVVVGVMWCLRRFVYKTEGDIQFSFAMRQALKRLEAAKSHKDLDAALMGYLSARLRREVNGMSWEPLKGVLMSHLVPDDVVERLGVFLESLHAAHYAPGGFGRELVNDKAELRALLEQLKRRV